jgi:hypothetical protein
MLKLSISSFASVPAAFGVAATLCFLPTSARAEDEPIFDYADESAQPATLEDFSPNVRSAPYFETWDVWMWTDDGQFILVQFLTSSFGFGIERQGSARLMLIEAGGSNGMGDNSGVLSGDRGFDWEKGDWNWDAENPLNITFKDCYVRGDGTTFEIRGRTRSSNLTVEATLTMDSPMHQPGDGRVEYGWDHHKFFDQQGLPRFNFTGRVNKKPDGQETDAWSDISGVGYAEHTLTNDYPFQVAKSFGGFRALRDDGLSIIWDSVTVPDLYGGRQVPWLLVLLDGQVVFESLDVSMIPATSQTENRDGKTYVVPTSYALSATSGGNSVQVRVSSSVLVSAESPLARMSSLLRSVLGSMMAPYDFELRSPYEAQIRIDGAVAQISGDGWSTFNFTK